MERYKLPFCHFFVACFIIIISCTSVQGQNKMFNASLVFGMQACQIDGDQMAGFNKLGSRIGVCISRNFNLKWGGNIYMIYSGKGSKKIYTENGPGPGLWDKAALHYVETGFSALYKLRKKFNFSLSLGAGYLGKAVIYDDFSGQRDLSFLKPVELSSSFTTEYKINHPWSVQAGYQQSVWSITTPFKNLSGYYTGFMINKLVFIAAVYNL